MGNPPDLYSQAMQEMSKEDFEALVEQVDLSSMDDEELGRQVERARRMVGAVCLYAGKDKELIDYYDALVGEKRRRG